MNFQNLNDGFNFQYASSLDHARHKLLEEEEAHKRQQRNQEIRSKIQELKLRSLLEASRSEMLRQMQNEHKALVQKYLYDRKLPTHHSILSYPDPTNSHPGQAMMRSDPTPQAPHSAVYVSTGINTDLTGPVMPIQAEPNFKNENAFSRSGEEKGLPEINFNQPSPAPILSQPREDIALQKPYQHQQFTPPSFQHNKVTGEEGDKGKEKMGFTTSKITFLDPSTSESEVTTSTAEGQSRHSGGGRRFSASNLTPTAAALRTFLTDDTSESNPTTSISISSRRKSLPGILNMTPPEGRNFLTTSKEGDNEVKKEEKDSNYVQSFLMEEDENGGCSESETTSIGESILDPTPLKAESEFHPFRVKEEMKCHQAENRQNESNTNSVEHQDGTDGPMDGSYGQSKNCDPETNESLHSSSSTPISQKIENQHNLLDKKKVGVKAYKEETLRVDARIYERTEDETVVGAINKGAGESESQQITVSEEDERERAPQQSHQFKLKLGVDEDSESSDKSGTGFSESAKATVAKDGKKESTKSGNMAEVEDDDDLDDFFDL